MKAILIPASIVALALSATVGASENLSPAAQQTKAQLAEHIGVNAEDFTLLELTQLNCRLEAAHTDSERKRLLEGIIGFGAPTPEASDASKEQLATQLGVNAGDFELTELVFLKTMVEDDDCAVSNPADWAKAGERLTFESAAAKQQLAAMLGVPATSYTLAELVKMRFEVEGETNK